MNAQAFGRNGETMFAVDIGNTCTRIAAYSGDVIRERRSFRTRELDVAELAGAFDAMKKAIDTTGGEKEKAWVASVSPGMNDTVDAAAERSGLERHFIHPGTDFIMPHRLTTPGTTGVDRLLSAMAAGARCFSAEERSGGYVVVQCGTAATVDLVDADGTFRGGYIIPGPTMWLTGVSGAAQLPDLSGEVPDWKAVWVGDNTRDAILHGMQTALPVAVAAAALRINTKESGIVAGSGAGAGLPVAVTGGWGEAVLPYVRAKHTYDRDLLLHGIKLFAGRNDHSA
jgi:type III pantothenate kinase